MWIFLLFLTIFQGLSTYLMCISIAQIKNNTKSIISIIKNISPYQLIEIYTPDKAIDNTILSILSRALLFITGFIGILLCIIIHDIYFIIYNNKNIDDKILNETSSIKQDTFFIIESKDTINNNNQLIDLFIDSSIYINLNLPFLICELSKYKIKYNNSILININNDEEELIIDNYDNSVIKIQSSSIDNALFTINSRYRKELIGQSVCICKQKDFIKTSTFKHLCIPIEDNADTQSIKFIEDLASKINSILK